MSLRENSGRHFFIFKMEDFIMPNIGSIIGTKVSFLIKKSNYIVSVVFFLLALEMYKSRNEEHHETLANMMSLIIFAFTIPTSSPLSL